MAVRIETAAFDPGAELTAFLKDSTGAGAAVTFTGLVRSNPLRPITTLLLDCYPDLARTQLDEIHATAIARFGLIRATIIHRYGPLRPGEPIVQVMTLAAHRRAAFEAAEYLMDYLKTDAAFWKKESSGSGEFWVDAHAADDLAKARWE